jgi:hypothetical protein
MSLRYTALCLLLGFIVLLLGIKNYDLWTQPIEGFLEEGGTKKGETKTETAAMTGGPRETTSMAATLMISEKNIFNPERKEFSVTIPDQSKPMMRPQIILYGVTIKEDYQSATIVNPGRPLQKGEREMMTLKIGERVGEYRLVKILPDRITMEAGEDSFEVLLYDANLPKRRTSIRTESRPAEVTTTSPAPAPAPAPVPKAAAAPAPVEPPRERVIEAPLPRPISPPLPSYPSTSGGRRPLRPLPSPQSEGK